MGAGEQLPLESCILLGCDRASLDSQRMDGGSRHLRSSLMLCSNADDPVDADSNKDNVLMYSNSYSQYS